MAPMGYDIPTVTSEQTHVREAVVLIWCFIPLVASPREKHP